MHPTQQKILQLAEKQDISNLTLRAMGELVGIKNSPQIIKHHLQQLKIKGLLNDEKFIKPYSISDVDGIKCINLPIVNPYKLREFLMNSCK